MLVKVKQLLYLVHEMVHVVHQHLLEPLGVCLVYEIVVNCPDKMKDRLLLPPCLQVVVNKAVNDDYYPARVHFCFLSAVDRSCLQKVVAYNPYLYDIPHIVAYPFPWGYLPFQELAFVGVVLEVLVLLEVKSPLPKEKLNHPEKGVDVNRPAVVYLLVVYNQFYVSHFIVLLNDINEPRPCAWTQILQRSSSIFPLSMREASALFCNKARPTICFPSFF